VPDSTAFALSDGRQTFVGATPERLIQKRGTRIQTEALAGTAARTEAPESLQRRVKDLQEHAFVVQEIARRLKGVCRELRIGKRPSLRRLTDVVHLRTEIRGTLAREAHVLALALRLHPTPAVGGLPGKQATRWIDAHEPVPRGWYAGFFGWFDAQGNGELSVSIRSGLLKGRGVQLFAGAGIVAQSNAAAEYLETALKQRTFLRVLGVRT
jgi:menaquinone-specific isochorismate synthase